MKPGSVKIVDRVSAVEAIKRLGEDDLIFLNRLIVDRLKLIAQARATTLMTSFTRGDRVGFQTPDGRIIHSRRVRVSLTPDALLRAEHGLGQRPFGWQALVGCHHLQTRAHQGDFCAAVARARGGSV